MIEIVRYLGQAVLVAALCLMAFQIVRRWVQASRKVGAPTAGDQLLFSLPTICDLYPPLAEAPHQPAQGEIVLHEDDWRQIEFVPEEDREYIEQQFIQHRRFRAQKRRGAGYTEIIVRPEHRVEFPRLGVPLAALRDALELSSWERLSINWEGSAWEVQGGFAVSLGHEVVLYGYAAQNVVQQLGLLVPVHEPSISCPETIERVGRFVKADLVDWYKLARIPGSDTPGLSEWWGTYGFQSGLPIVPGQAA
jgi:hypothetical protein